MGQSGVTPLIKYWSKGARLATIKYYTYNRNRYAGFAEVDDDKDEEIMEKLLKLKHVTSAEIQKNNKQRNADKPVIITLHG